MEKCIKQQKPTGFHLRVWIRSELCKPHLTFAKWRKTVGNVRPNQGSRGKKYPHHLGRIIQWALCAHTQGTPPVGGSSKNQMKKKRTEFYFGKNWKINSFVQLSWKLQLTLTFTQTSHFGRWCSSSGQSQQAFWPETLLGARATK